MNQDSIKGSDLVALGLAFLIVGGLVFGQFERARIRASSTACAQNLKMMALATMQYEQDRGEFPAGRKYLGSKEKVTDMIKWFNAVVPYMSSDERATSAMGPRPAGDRGATELAGLAPGEAPEFFVDAFQCPSAQDWDRVGYNMTYGYNFHYLGNADPTSLFPEGKPGFGNFPVNRRALPRPDKTLAFADSDGTGYMEYQSAGKAKPDFRRQGAFAYLLDPPFLPQVKETNPLLFAAAAGGILVDGEDASLKLAEPNPAHQAYRSIVAGRHHGMANVAFLDGHIEMQSRESLYFQNVSQNPEQIVFSPSNALWNGYGFDNDANGNGEIEKELGERLIDPNAAFHEGTDSIAPSMLGFYNPSKPGDGPSQYTRLQGSYANFGPGFSPALFFNMDREDLLGPTLPRVAPLRLAGNE